VKTLLDTCVLTELRQPWGHPAVKSAVAEIPDADLYLSVLTVGEIAKGIGLLAAGRKKKALTSWLTGLETKFGDRILAIDIETAWLWGELTARAQKSGIIIPGVAGLLAATALRHGLRVMTRNTGHFEASGALIIDPWQNT
jgi:predicted nucleic acid-binding protein